MPRKKKEHQIAVELTAYGWAVSEDGARIGLFVNKDAAMNQVRIRGKALQKLGELWSLTVVGVEPPSNKNRYSPTRR